MRPVLALPLVGYLFACKKLGENAEEVVVIGTTKVAMQALQPKK